MSNKLTQTELGNMLGLSSVAIGKKLVELNLRDESTKLATNYAIKKGFAKNITYEKYGKNISMTIWSKETIKFIKEKISNDYDAVASLLLGKFKLLKKIEDEDDGSKIKQLELEFFYEDFEKDFKIFMNKHEIMNLFYKKLEKEKLLSYAENVELLKDLKVISRKYDLDLLLSKKSSKGEINKI